MTSSEPISPQHLTEIKALIERAHTEIGEVASQGVPHRWRMSVPADASRDTDLIISEALNGAEDLAAEVDRLNSYVNSIDRLNEVADADWKQEVDRLKREVRRLEADAAREEQITGNLIDERDDLHALLDKFAAMVAPIEVIGEHSSGNDPWLNALDLVTPAAEVDRLNARLSKALATIDRVARIRPVEHGCDDGSVSLFVYADHLRAALGITSDGTAVAP